MSELFPTSKGTSAWRWVSSNHQEVRMLGLPDRIPWPGELPDPPADEPLRVDELLRAIPRALEDPSVDLAPVWGKVEPFIILAAECREAMGRRDYKEVGRALAKLEGLLDCPALWILQADFFIFRRNEKGAVRMLERVVSTLPDCDMGWMNLGAIPSNGGNREKAIRAYLDGWKACPGSEALAKVLIDYRQLFRFGRQFAKPGEWHLHYVSADNYRRAVEERISRYVRNPGELEKLSLDVQGHDFDPEGEELVYRAILAIDPEHSATLVRLASLHLKAGDVAKADGLLAKAGKVDGEVEIPTDPDLLFQLHALALKRGDKSGSDRWLDAALEIDPNHVPSVQAKFVEDIGLSSEEREDRLMVFARERTSWVAACQAQLLANKRRDFARSAEFGELAWRMNPSDGVTFIRFTDDLLSLREHEKLAALLQPEYRAGRLTRARKSPYATALYQLGQKKEALRILDEMLRDKELPQSWRPRLMEQREVWTGYIVPPAEDHLLDHEIKPHRLTGAVMLVAVNGEDCPPTSIFPAKTPANTKYEIPFDAIPPGISELSLSIAQQRGGIFKRKKQIGIFTVKGIEPKKLRVERLFITFRYIQEGWMYLSARQGKRKLKIEWGEPKA